MSEASQLQSEIDVLRERLRRLTEAVLRVSEDLDLDTVLQEVVDSARTLTEAQYSAIVTLDDDGEIQDLVFSGLSPEEEHTLLNLAGGGAIFRYLMRQQEPLISVNFSELVRSLGFVDIQPPVTTFLGTRINARERHVGSIYIGGKLNGTEFTRDDSETLAIFAAQAAVAINNARRYGEEQRAKADLEALVNTSPVGVLVFDAKTRGVVTFNQEARRIVGLARDEALDFNSVLERTTFRRMDGHNVHADDLPLERVIRTGETVRAEEIVLSFPENREVTTLFNATPIHADDGTLVSVVITVQDITPLEELERLRAEFLGMVSHELRKPLAAIKGSASTVLNTATPMDPAETRQFFDIVEEQADQMRDLINNLLDLTRIEAGTLQVTPEPTDLAALVEQAKSAFSSSGYRNVIEINLPQDLPRIIADGTRIVQVLYNLFSNAAKHSPEWSSINVTAAQDGLRLIVAISDEGRGIMAEHLPYLFTKFSMVDHDGANRIDGYGLGLAICKGIIEAHGGRISAHSEGRGRGAEFTFTVPVADEHAPAAPVALEPPTRSVQRPDSDVVRILIVDDDPQVLRFVRNGLIGAGYDALATDDPSQVHELLETEAPQLVLLNLVLPGTDGFDLIASISQVSSTPVIFISGRGRGEDIAKAFDLGAADYIVKPFSSAELLARVKAALRKQAMYDQALALEPFVLDELRVDFVERRVTLDGQRIPLTQKEYQLLATLATNAGRSLGHEELTAEVWQEGAEVDSRLLRTFVKKLRQKLGDDARNPRFIFTESGIGYRVPAPAQHQ